MQMPFFLAQPCAEDGDSQKTHSNIEHQGARKRHVRCHRFSTWVGAILAFRQIPSEIIQPTTMAKDCSVPSKTLIQTKPTNIKYNINQLLFKYNKPTKQNQPTSNTTSNNCYSNTTSNQPNKTNQHQIQHQTTVIQIQHQTNHLRHTHRLTGAPDAQAGASRSKSRRNCIVTEGGGARKTRR